MSAAAVELQDVSYSYDSLRVLENITMEVREGEFLAVIGPNGGGKTTLLKLMLGLLQPGTGRIRVLGMEPARSSRYLGYVPQHASFYRDFPITVEEIVLQGRLGAARWWGGYSKEDRARAQRALEQAEIAHLAQRPLSTLSGGQLQRVLIARALVVEPRILLMDEPTANVDSRVEHDIFELLREINRSVTIIVVSHDVGFVSRYVSRIACLDHSLHAHCATSLDETGVEHRHDDTTRAVTHMHVGGDGI